MSEALIVALMGVLTTIISGLVTHMGNKSKLSKDSNTELHKDEREFRAELRQQIVDLKKEIADLKSVNDSLEKTIDELRERNITLKLKNIELENKFKNSFNNNNTDNDD